MCPVEWWPARNHPSPWMQPLEFPTLPVTAIKKHASAKLCNCTPGQFESQTNNIIWSEKFVQWIDGLPQITCLLRCSHWNFAALVSQLHAFNVCDEVCSKILMAASVQMGDPQQAIELLDRLLEQTILLACTSQKPGAELHSFTVACFWFLWQGVQRIPMATSEQMGSPTYYQSARQISQIRQYYWSPI